MRKFLPIASLAIVLIIGAGFMLHNREDTSTPSGEAASDVNWNTIQQLNQMTQDGKIKKQKKKVPIDLYTNWGGWLKRMDQNTFGDTTISNNLNKNFHPLLFAPSQIHSQKLEIFAMYYDYHVEHRKKFHFTPLTDKYLFYKYQDTAVISQEYLGYNTHSRKNFHTLDSTSRNIFLNRIAISASDTIFIYNIVNDTIYQHLVAEVPLVAFLNLYIHEPPYEDRHYMIGFAFDTLAFLPDHGYFTTLVYVGQENPFLTGNVEPIRWQQIDRTGFPTQAKDSIRTLLLNSFQPSHTYTFSTEKLDYFAQEMTHRNISWSRAMQLVVIHKTSGKVLYNKFHTGGESSDLMPIANEQLHYLQWTGKIFKDKPPILYGLRMVTFGCPMIDFIDQHVSPIEIYCDNRH